MKIRIVNYVSDKRVEIYSLAERKTLLAVFNSPSIIKVKQNKLGRTSQNKKYNEYFVYNEKIKAEEPLDYKFQEIAYFNNLINEIEYEEVKNERLK